MAKRSLLTTFNAVLRHLPREGADVAQVLQHAGVKTHQAGQLLGAISDPNGTFLRGAQALVEGRLGVEFVDGRVGLKIREPEDAQDSDDAGGDDDR